jgi:arylsulfatase
LKNTTQESCAVSVSLSKEIVMGFPRVLFLVLALIVFLCPCAWSSEKPNIVLIVIDDMGYSDIAPFGAEIRTPNLDRLASSGTKFTNFYVGPACSPTRSMLMSGNDNHVAGMGSNAEAMAPNQLGQPGYEGYLNERIVPMVELLREAGYQTYMAGKWHLGEEPEHDPFRRGFDKSYAMLQGGASHFDDEWMMCANYTPIYRENGVRTHVPRGFYSSEFYTDKVIEYIDEGEKENPFFAYLAFTAVHDPLHIPDEWLDKYKGRYKDGYAALREERLRRMKEMGLVPGGTELGPWLAMVPTWDKLTPEQKKEEARRMEIYAAMVENTDFHIGRLLDHLETSGQIDNTLIIFFSDNGANGMPMHAYPGTDEAWVERNSDNRFENWGRRGSRIAEGMGWAQASVTPFRLFKGFIAEGGIRAPLIVSGPGVPEGEIKDAFAHVMDLAPTFLETAGISYPATWEGKDVLPMRGKSMLPLLTGKSEQVRTNEEPVGWELLGWRALRMGKWKITWIDKPFGESNWQLFDLESDPGETKDLSFDNPQEMQRLLKLWEAYENDVGIIYSGEGMPVSF